MRRVIRKVFNEGDSADADARGAGVAARSRPPGPCTLATYRSRPLLQSLPLKSFITETATISQPSPYCE